MRALFRLTGKPLADLVLVCFWWPIALLIWGAGLLVRRLEPSIERGRAALAPPAVAPDPAAFPARDADRQAAVAFATRRMSNAQGVIMPDRLDPLAELTMAAERARTWGELAALVGAPADTPGLFPPPPEPEHVRRRRVAIVAIVGGVAFLGCAWAALVVTAYALTGGVVPAPSPTP